jgi:hypothetical protein
MPITRRTLVVALVGLALVLGGSLRSLAQTPAPAIEAKLVDPEKNAHKGWATVTVTLTGVEMIDPASVMEQPKKGQGHLHYRVDDGPVIATTSTKLSFHDLKPGARKFEVTLVGNDHNPLGPKTSLSVTVPKHTPSNPH